MPYDDFMSLANQSSALCEIVPDVCDGAARALRFLVNESEEAMQLSIILPAGIDPFGDRGGQWIETMRDAMAHIKESNNFPFEYFLGEYSMTNRFNYQRYMKRCFSYIYVLSP